jgi:AmiR/NasT family two-component response regulator
MTLPRAQDPSTTTADVYRAEGVLAERLGLDLPAAGQVLRDEAAIRALPMLDVAREVLGGQWEQLPTVVLDPWGSC